VGCVLHGNHLLLWYPPYPVDIHKSSGGRVTVVAGTSSARLREAADLIAADAKRRAGLWSERIPGSFTVTVSGDVAQVTAGGDPAPMAYTFENPRGGAGVWHPVFADGPRERWTWVRQDPRPFLEPAAEAMAERAAIVYAQVVDDHAMQLGWS